MSQGCAWSKVDVTATDCAFHGSTGISKLLEVRQYCWL